MMLTKTMIINAKIEICKTFDKHDVDFGDDNDSNHKIFWITMIIGDLDPDHEHGYQMICMTRPCDNDDDKDDDDDDDKDDNADAAFDDNEIKEVHTHWATRSGLRDGSLVMHFSLNQHHQHYHYHHYHHHDHPL